MAYKLSKSPDSLALSNLIVTAITVESPEKKLFSLGSDSSSISQPNNLAEESADFPRQLDIATVSIYGLALLSAGMFLFLPFINLLAQSPWKRSLGTMHSLAALLSTIIACYLGHLAFPLLRGSTKVLPQVRTLSLWSTLLTFLGLATGNIAYMRYRASAETGGTMEWLKENSPLSHSIFMNYHQFSVWFALPLGVACTWVLWQYGDSILSKPCRPVLTAVCIGLMATMFFSMGGLVTGLAIAKIRGL